MVNEYDRATSALMHLDSGCPRKEWVKVGMAAKAAGLTFDVFHEWSASAANYGGERDCRAVWQSFREGGGIAAGSLFAMAFAEGWQDPAKHLRTANGNQVGVPIAATRKAPVTPIKQAESANAAEVWRRCEPAPANHAYIIRKGGLPDGLRFYPDGAPPLVIRGESVAGWLTLPCRDLDGTLQTLQFIQPKGDKLNLPGASFGNGCHVVGEIGDCIHIVEGIGQAWAVHAATDAAAVVCFGAGRMATVAAAIRERHPAARLVLLPDRGKEVQAAEIARAVNGSWCELPADKPANFDVNDYAIEHGADALADLLRYAKEAPKPESRFRLLGSADLRTLPPLRWRIRGVLPATGVAALYGPSASGKSFLALDMAAAVAGGHRWFDCRVDAAPVVYAALEGEAGCKLRVEAWEAHQARKLPDGLRMVLQPFKLTERQDVIDLAAVVPSGAVVFIDTLNRAAPTADENSSRDMGAILEAAKQLQAMTGGLIVLVHHTGKDATKGLRGHSSLFAALDAAIEVSRNGERREWRVAKSKDGQDGNAHFFRLQVKEVGEDEHGDPVSSCVVVRDFGGEEIKRVKVPKGANQKLVAQALRPLFLSGVTGKPGVPATRPCIELERAVVAGAAALTCPTDKRTSRAREAITGMVEDGYFGCSDGWLWVK
jgi:hypothetical protein